MSVVRKGLRRGKDILVFLSNQFSQFFRRLFVKEQHQLTSTTAANRYPELFTEAKWAMANKTNLSILSFGCSTGEECFTMKSYFPQAEIIGVDINKNNLKKAQAKNTSSHIQFLNSTSTTIEQHGKYDMIFCLSVLCRWEDTKDLENCERIYPFVKFSETVAHLADQILPDGLFIIYNSNFRFEDTSAFKNFEIVSTQSVINSGFVHKFDSYNQRLRQEHRPCIYRKKN